MIKILNFNSQPYEIGGAQVPAIAFKKWMDILKVKSEVITDMSKAHGADGYFLATPGPFKVGSRVNLDAPFCVMIHAEFDSELYPDFNYYIKHPFCRAVAVITEGWDLDRKLLKWHPCTLPEYLIQDEDEPYPYLREGLIYCARISRWKSPDTLAELTKFGPFMRMVGNKVTVIGKGGHEIAKGNYLRVDERHNIYDYEATKNLYSGYKYFWDYASHPNISRYYKRLNLAAIEAMKFGCVPIINIEHTHHEAHKFAIDLGRGFSGDFRSRQVHMFEVVKKSDLSYNAIKQQVIDIVDIIQP